MLGEGEDCGGSRGWGDVNVVKAPEWGHHYKDSIFYNQYTLIFFLMAWLVRVKMNELFLLLSLVKRLRHCGVKYSILPKELGLEPKKFDFSPQIWS